MDSDADLYKRLEDKKWRESVDTRLVSLTSAQKTTDDEIDDLAESVAAHDSIIHGNPRERDTGMIGQVNSLETAVNGILALLHPDHLGHGGLINEHNELMGRRKYREQTRSYYWQFWTAVVAAVIGFAGLIVSNWPALESWFKKEAKTPVQWERKIKPKKHHSRSSSNESNAVSNDIRSLGKRIRGKLDAVQGGSQTDRSESIDDSDSGQ